MKTYESYLGHNLDIDALAESISGRYEHRRLKKTGALRVFRNGYGNGYNFDLYGNGRIVFKAESQHGAELRICKIIRWVRDQQFVIAKEDIGVRELT